ncbi:MAG TPA: ABC transporter permease [Chryseosolibacter sp.]|nr:ABC transporter permease [Chryseosolibacter sp.]
MNKENDPRPPRWAERLLGWYCKPALLEDLQGDLHEFFLRNCKSKGVRVARLTYVIDVLKFFRLYTIRKPEFLNLLIHWIMLGSYIKTSGRSIVRNKLFSAINIIGLSISMSVGLLVIAMISDLLSYDRFHANGERIFRVNTHHTDHLNRKLDLASTSVATGKKIQENFTGVEAATVLRRGFAGDAWFGDNVLSVEGLWADHRFFDIFSFDILHGDGRTALDNPYSLVLTETSARKLFGESDVVGKTMKLFSSSDTSDYTVTAVLRDVPKFSHIQFEAIGSFTTKEIIEKDNAGFGGWESVWMNYVYVLLPENGSLSAIQESLDKLCAEQNKTVERKSIALSLQSINDIAMGPDLSNPIGPTIMNIVIYVLAGLAFIVILSACFNYTNLSIARSLRRSKEVGIRKVIGAHRSHVAWQFITESVIISVAALVFAFGIFMFLRPQFLNLAPDFLKIVQLDLSGPVVAYFLLFAIFVGIVAGILPALFFARINAIQVLKNATAVKVFRKVTLRKALIVVQYTVSLMFIASTLIGFKQYKHFLAFDLGFTTANVLNIKLQRNKADVVMKKLSEIKDIEMMSRSQMVTSVGSYWGAHMRYSDPNDSINVWYNTIDENYLPLHGHKLIAGRNFTPKVSTHEESEVIVNEQVLKALNIAGHDAQKAIGEVVTLEKKKLQIVGVMKDFHYGKVDSSIEPVIFRYSNEPDGFINAKVLSDDLPATLDAIERKWKKVDRVHPLSATFYDDQIEEAYSQFSVMSKVIGFLAFLAVVISSIGLFGMVVFTTETRLKEISIRKVLGASEGVLIFVLSRGFLLLLLTAGVIALPLTYLFFEKVVLSEIVYHAPISVFDMIAAVMIILVVALMMIGSQTLKAAKTNPAQVLKAE